ncbi:MAG: hypothetical protein N2593_03125 [Patescibacteria group bacterium]|nr:hypothetical protein [Patescibacteria group bacterium]
MEQNNKKTFTIIEILIIVSFISIFSFFGIVNYYNYNEDIKLKNEAKKISEVFNLTKKRAISSFLYDKNCLNFSGYQITIDSSSKKYEVYFGCNQNYSKIDNYSLPQNIFFTTQAVYNFYFSPMGQNITIPINNLRLKNSSTNRCIDIFIRDKAIIEINKSLFSC